MLTNVDHAYLHVAVRRATCLLPLATRDLQLATCVLYCQPVGERERERLRQAMNF